MLKIKMTELFDLKNFKKLKNPKKLIKSKMSSKFSWFLSNLMFNYFWKYTSEIKLILARFAKLSVVATTELDLSVLFHDKKIGVLNFRFFRFFLIFIFRLKWWNHIKINFKIWIRKLHKRSNLTDLSISTKRDL